MNEHSGHDRFAREMALEIIFVHGDVLYPHNSLPAFHFFNGVHQQKGGPVRQNLLDFIDVEQHG